ncbi:hypothetical protein, partial [Streptomyces sp. NPDC094468]|uniref:hypothetical protein n=1 Tax=Streptomyces sp. NPDC094468 TaxID=3366066 RepID=UPI0038164D7F
PQMVPGAVGDGVYGPEPQMVPGAVGDGVYGPEPQMVPGAVGDGVYGPDNSAVPATSKSRPRRIRNRRTTSVLLAGGVLSSAAFALLSGGASPTSQNLRQNDAASVPDSAGVDASPATSGGSQSAPSPSASARTHVGVVSDEGVVNHPFSASLKNSNTENKEATSHALPIVQTTTAPRANSDTPSPTPTPKSSSSASIKGTTLHVYRDEQLMPGQSWKTNRVALTMQTDGDLVLRDLSGIMLWHSGTAGTGYRAIMQADGNFVVYDRSDWGVWSTGTAHRDGASLYIGSDGNVSVVYDNKIMWTTGIRS